MRLDFVRVFVDSTSLLFKEFFGPEIEVSSISMKANPIPGREVLSIIGIAGEAQGRVIFDMDASTAIKLAEHMMGEPTNGLTPLVRSSIAELSSMAIGRAISTINDNGTRLRMSPPTVITGVNLLSYDQCFETLVAPITTAYGEVGVSITLQDLD